MVENIEIEFKFNLENPEELIERLNSVASSEHQDLYQKDTYFVPVHRDFLGVDPVSEWLRLRHTEKGCSVNYKNWYFDEEGKNSSYCDEFETGVEDIGILLKIFKKLDISEVIVVEKIRNTWMYKNVEIAVDKVTELGHYIELEYKGDGMDIEENKTHLHRVLEELGAKTGPQNFLGYPMILLKKRGEG
jgi:adenylate cyclase, class 2